MVPVCKSPTDPAFMQKKSPCAVGKQLEQPKTRGDDANTQQRNQNEPTSSRYREP